jgi:superfamily II DNA helicase RecQ
MLVVRPTGGGKSLVYQVAGYLMKGITLFISPLLALASDQTRKLRMITRNRPEFVSLHLDDMEESSINELAHDISTWKEPDSSQCAISVIIFASPQLLVGSKGTPILNILLDRNKSILSMTVMDEVHIASQFGSTFRTEFKMLKRKFYSQLPACCNTNIFMTGTCTLAIVHNFETLFGVKINCTHWPKHNDMRHRSVGIILKYTSAPMNDIKKVIDTTMKGRSASQSRKIIIYSNMRDKIVQLGKKVEDYLEIDEATYPIDLVILHGHLTRKQKASYLKRFVNVTNTTTIDHDVRILCATSGVANAGIDSKHVYCALRAEFPPSIQDMCQEKGRVGRIPSATPDIFTYVVCFDVESFVLLLRRTLNPEEKMTQMYRNNMLKDHIQVAQLFTSIHTCFNHYFEIKLSNPFHRNSDTPLAIERCNHCPGCTDDLQRLYRRVVRDVGQEILFSAFTSASKYKIGDLVKFFSERNDLDRRLFARNRRTVPKQEIKRFIFQLIAWEILIPKYEVESKSIVLEASKLTQPAMFRFQSIDAWENIPCF